MVVKTARRRSVFFYHGGPDITAIKSVIAMFGPQLGINFIKDAVIQQTRRLVLYRPSKVDALVLRNTCRREPERKLPYCLFVQI